MIVGRLSAAIALALAVTAQRAAAAGVPTFTYAPLSAQAARSDIHPAGGSPSIVEAAVTIDQSGARPISGVIVGPRDGRKHPAVLWVHWLGDPMTTNHTEFLSEARELAAAGVVSMLLDLPWSAPNWFATRKPNHDTADVVGTVISLRRALDVLSFAPGVDRDEMAYVGHDFGAMVGALLLAVDERPRFAVLMTPTVTFWEWYLLGDPPQDRRQYVRELSIFDLPGWLQRGHQRATLLQFARRDVYVASSTAIAIRNSVPDRDRTLTTFDSGHALGLPAARKERDAWLRAHFFSGSLKRR